MIIFVFLVIILVILIGFNKEPMKIAIYWILVTLTLTTLIDGQNALTLEDIYGSSKFYEDKIHDFHWTNDGKGFIYRKASKIALNPDFIYYDLINNEQNIFIKGSEINRDKYDSFNIRNVIWSPNEKYLLFTDRLPARDFKSGGDFFIYNIKMKILKSFNNLDIPKSLAQFSPDSKYIGYIKQNNLFIADLENSNEKQLSFDGGDYLLNGQFDWVYEEEFDIIKGWQWSPDSKYIAFWQLDESQVPEFEIQLYNSLYPKNIIQRYPKAGQANSKVKIGVVHVETGKITWFDFDDDDFYIPRIQWSEFDNQLAIMKLNRLQNNIEIFLGNVNTGKLKKIFTEFDSRWIEITDDLQFLKNSTRYIWTSEKSGFRHIYLNNYETQESIQITSGDWQIRKVIGIDEINNHINLSATKESVLENHLYRIDFNGKNIKKLTDLEGWHEVSFSPDFKYFFDEYSNITTPTKSLLYDNSGKQLTTLVENDMEVLASYNLSSPEFLQVPTKDNVLLNAWILKPYEFDSDKEYPLFIYTYGGPGSQKVQNKWGIISMWYHLLSQKGIIVACVDNRGTEGRGAEFKKYVYKKLGQLDVKDQITAAKYFSSLDYIDENRIGMYGWSYGGYMAPMCLMQGNEVIKLAVAVAPVTDWKFYDTIYTERYMQTPVLNKEGYELGSILNYVNLLKGKLLLIHGMADDNVHFQNSAELVKEMVKQNKDFDVMFYPDRNHGIRGGGLYTREHVYNKITTFILENL